MKRKYAIRNEYSDSTMSDATSFFGSKAEAFRVARWISKTSLPGNIVRIWVDDYIQNVGLKSFEVSK